MTIADRATVSDDAQGKQIVDDSGEKLGVVSEVRAGTAHVDSGPGITDTVSPKMGWSDADDSPLPADEIALVADEIRLA